MSSLQSESYEFDEVTIDTISRATLGMAATDLPETGSPYLLDRLIMALRHWKDDMKLVGHDYKFGDVYAGPKQTVEKP